jgi:hypothetical protein
MIGRRRRLTGRQDNGINYAIRFAGSFWAAHWGENAMLRAKLIWLGIKLIDWRQRRKAKGTYI